MGRATNIEAGVTWSCSEYQQTEEPNGESTSQVTAVRDVTCVQQRVTIVICQGSGLIRAAPMLPEEPNN